MLSLGADSWGLAPLGAQSLLSHARLVGHKHFDLDSLHHVPRVPKRSLSTCRVLAASQQDAGEGFFTEGSLTPP